jgi:hypothetical protein
MPMNLHPDGTTQATHPIYASADRDNDRHNSPDRMMDMHPDGTTQATHPIYAGADRHNSPDRMMDRHPGGTTQATHPYTGSESGGWGSGDVKSEAANGAPSTKSKPSSTSSGLGVGIVVAAAAVLIVGMYVAHDLRKRYARAAGSGDYSVLNSADADAVTADADEYDDDAVPAKSPKDTLMEPLLADADVNAPLGRERVGSAGARIA